MEPSLPASLPRCRIPQSCESYTSCGGEARAFGAGSSQPDGGAAAAWGYGDVEERLAWAGNLKAARRVEKLAEGRAVLAPFYRRC